MPLAAAAAVACHLLRFRTMDEAISLDLNGKLTLRLRLVRGAVVAARTGWADTRVWANRLCPPPGESFHTNHRRPILQLVQDTCGVHDLLTAPCDEHRYRLYGVQEEHASCAGNFRQVMAPFLGSVAPSRSR